MLRTSHRLKLLATLLCTTAACTQEPAVVDLKGHNTYSRDGTSYAAYAPASGGYDNRSSYSAPAPVYRNVSTRTESTAGVQSIGVSDLAPPTASGGTQSASSSGKPANSPFKPASREIQTASAEGAINPWTRKPRDINAFKPREELAIRPQGKSSGAKKNPYGSEVRIVTQAEQQKMEELDKIVGNDSEIAAAAKTKTTAAAAGADSAFMWPVSSKKVISSFGPKGSGKVNDGINIASSEGEPVWAAADGEVVYVGNELQGYGNMVLIKHSDNKATTYAHLNRANVDKYDRVKQGDIIGYVGSTGNVRKPQLHFAIRDGKDPVDPMKHFNRNVASLR